MKKNKKIKDNMINFKLLLKLWGYQRVNMTNVKLF